MKLKGCTKLIFELIGNIAFFVLIDVLIILFTQSCSS